DHEPEPGSAADLAVAALNGIAGDRLAHDRNPLAVKMALRCGNQMVAASPLALAAAYPQATPRIALFVHGLAGNETTWRFYSRDHYGKDHTTYGTRLQSDLGYTPLYMRYNSGLHVSENGRRLARLIEAIVRAWPVPIEEIILVGHSMGGLVLRSASH